MLVFIERPAPNPMLIKCTIFIDRFAARVIRLPEQKAENIFIARHISNAMLPEVLCCPVVFTSAPVLGVLADKRQFCRHRAK